MKNLHHYIILFLLTFIVLPVYADNDQQTQVKNEIIEIGTSNSQAKQQNQAVNTKNKLTDSAAASSDIVSEQTPQAEQSGYSQGSVTRSIFTTQITEHEPVDKIEKLPSTNRSVYYFTELRDMSGQTAVHRWEFNGNVMAETKFTIAGPRWRVWSSKNLLPSWTGEWKVSVLNGVGDVISEDIFSYVETVNETKVQKENTPVLQSTNDSSE